jgi:Asparaginase, N-terminal
MIQSVRWRLHARLMSSNAHTQKVQGQALAPCSYYDCPPPHAGTKEATPGLRPGTLLRNVLDLVPELSAFANLDLKVVYNKDSSNCGPTEWKQLARMLHKARRQYDAFIHGTDTA